MAEHHRQEGQQPQPSPLIQNKMRMKHHTDAINKMYRTAPWKRPNRRGEGRYGVNGVALAPDGSSAGRQRRTPGAVEDAGIEVLELPMDHIMAGWGRCTARRFLRRDPIQRG